MNFIVSTGEVDNVINIMKEVASWGRSVGLNLWKNEHLTKEKLIKLVRLRLYTSTSALGRKGCY